MNNARGHNKNGPGPSRREFLRGSGAAAAATALATAPVTALAEEAEPPPRAVGHEYDPGPALDALDAHQPTARITQSGTAPTLGLAHVVV